MKISPVTFTGLSGSNIVWFHILHFIQFPNLWFYITLHSQTFWLCLWFCVGQPGPCTETHSWLQTMYVPWSPQPVWGSGRLWSKNQFCLRNWPKLERLFVHLFSMDLPPPPYFSVCSSRLSLYLSLYFSLSLSLSLSLSPDARRQLGVTYPALSLSLSLSLSFKPDLSWSSQFHSLKKGQGKKDLCPIHAWTAQRLRIDRKLCSLIMRSDAMDKTIRKADTKKRLAEAHFLEDFSHLSKRTSTLGITESYCEKARSKRKQIQQSWKETLCHS